MKLRIKYADYMNIKGLGYPVKDSYDADSKTVEISVREDELVAYIGAMDMTANDAIVNARANGMSESDEEIAAMLEENKAEIKAYLDRNYRGWERLKKYL